MKSDFVYGLLIGTITTTFAFGAWALNSENFIKIAKIESKTICPDYVNQEGMKFAGYGKMELPREGIFKDETPNIFTWSLDKEKTELYIAKSNARNFGADIDIRYKIVEVYYKDVESK